MRIDAVPNGTRVPFRLPGTYVPGCHIPPLHGWISQRTGHRLIELRRDFEGDPVIVRAACVCRTVQVAF